LSLTGASCHDKERNAQVLNEDGFHPMAQIMSPILVMIEGLISAA